MSALGIIERARNEGLEVSVSSGGKLKICGEAATVAKWRPVLSEHKASIVAALAPYPSRADLTQRISTMATRWRYTDGDLAAVLTMAAFDPIAWWQAVIFDEGKFGFGEKWPLQ